VYSWGKGATLIAVTGWGQQQDRQRTSQAGFDVHLVKPVSEVQLFGALASADQRKQGTDAASHRDVREQVPLRTVKLYKVGAKTPKNTDVRGTEIRG
jgi:hypothetical protein